MKSNKVVKVPRPQNETLHQARVQFDFLAGSCAAFDNGKVAEAQRIAAALRILLYSSRLSTPLLQQAGVMDKLWVFDSAGEFLENDGSSALSLAAVHMDVDADQQITGVYYRPIFGEAPREQPSIAFQVHELMEGRKAPRGAGFHLRADDWWQMVVVTVPGGPTFSRRLLVERMANADGGAHVDPEIEEDYYALSRLNSVGIHAGSSGKEFALALGGAPGSEYVKVNKMAFTELGSPVPAYLRQIAWELMRSVKKQFPELMEAP